MPLLSNTSSREDFDSQRTGKGPHPFEIVVWSLHYDGARKRFSVDDFRFDQWCQTECPDELSPMWTGGDSFEMSIMFERDVDALKLINWLRTEGQAVTGRIEAMPG